MSNTFGGKITRNGGKMPKMAGKLSKSRNESLAEYLIQSMSRSGAVPVSRTHWYI